MKPRSVRDICLCLAALLLFVSLVLPPALANGGPTGTDLASGPFAAGRLLVKFQPWAPKAMTDALLVEHGLTIQRRLDVLDVYVVSAPEGEELATARQLKRNLTVRYAEPDYIYRAFLTPNDPYYAGDQWNLPHINAPAAWDITTGSNSVIIAVVDTGVDLSHPDLSSKLVAGYDFVNDDSTPQDDEGHGTHVAGTAAAITNNGVGVAGVSWGARIMPIKVLDSQGSGYTSDIAEGCRWAADHGAQIINMSLGGPGSSSTFQDAINYVYGRGLLTVAAAGNEYQRGNPTSYPAAYPHVVAVAAVNDSDGHASYSNTGFYVDIAAPGGDPTGSGDTNPRHWIMSTIWNGGSSYGRSAGTSMASPHVAGLASLVWSRHASWTNDQVEWAIESTAVDLGTAGRDDIFGWGRIDVRAAVALDNLTPTPTPTPSNCLAESAHPYANNTNQTWTITNPDVSATYSKIHFSRIETESGYDVIIVKDGSGSEIQRFTGSYASGVWSSSVPGRTVQVQLTTNSSVTAWGFCVNQIQTAQPSAWQIKQSLSLARSRLAVAAVNGKLYAIGGESAGAAAAVKGQEDPSPGVHADAAVPLGWDGRVEEYNPATNAWTTKATMPTRVSNISAGVINNKIYIPGGYDGSAAVSTLQIYDPATNAWTTGASLPAARSGAGVAVLNSQLYVIGGNNGSSDQNTVYRYDPATNSWTQRASLNYARSWPGVAGLNGKIYVAGGISSSSDLSSVEEYNPTANTWTMKAALSTGRGGPGAVAAAGYLYVVGGGWSSYLNTAERYNPATNSWAAIDSMNVGRRTLGLAELDSYLYAVGGYSGSYSAVNERYALTPVADPDIDVTPASLSVALGVGQTATRTLTIRNTGQGTLNFTISESAAHVSESAATLDAQGDGESAADVSARQELLRGEVDEAGKMLNPAKRAPEPAGADQVKTLPLRILCYGLDGSVSRTEQQRLTSLGATVTTVTDPNQITESYLNQFDVLFIGYAAELRHGSLSGRAAAIQSYIAGGGGVILEQPNVTDYQCGFLPSGFGVTVANSYWPGYPSNDPLQFTSAGQTHPMFAGLTTDSLSGNFDTVYDSALGSSYTRLARLQNNTSVIAVAVGQHGNGRIVFETGNFCQDSSDPGSDAYVTQMFLWAAGSGGDVPWLSENPTSGSVAAGGSAAVNVTFNSTGLQAGVYRANLLIASNDPDEAQVTVPVSMTVSSGPAPDIDVTPTSLNVTVDVGGSAQRTLTVRNTGQGSLTFQIGEAARTAGLPLTSASSVEPKLAGQATIGVEPKRQEGESTADVAVAAGIGPAGGGPDPFGYVYKTSGEAGGPTYNWIEIAPPAGGNGTEITGLTGVDDGHFWPLPLPFNFNFYGTAYNNLAVGTNGVLYFENNYLGLGNVAIPGTNGYGVSRFIAHLWDDLYVSPGAIYYRAEADRLIVEYYRVSTCCVSPDSATWEVILYSNGNLLYQYQDVTFGTTRDRGGEATVGIQGDNSTGLQFSFNNPALSDSLAICFAYPGQSPNCSTQAADVPWLSENPTSGTVAAGGSTAVNVTFNAAGLTPGSYLANLIISSNDPDEAQVTVPVAMNVTQPGGVTMVVDPASRNAAVGEIFTLDLKIQAGSQLVDAADAYLSFDRTKLRVVDPAGNETNSIIPGTALGLILQNTADNATGRVTFSAGRQFGSPAPSGSFTLATIRFKAMAETGGGGTPIAFLTGTGVYYQGNSILQGTSNGVVIVEAGGLVGRVTLQGRGNPPSNRWQGYPVRVLVYAPGGTTPQTTVQATLDASGVFTATGIAAGTYDIAVKNAHSLSNRKANVTVPSGSQIAFGTLLEGDASDNDRIAGEDFSILATAYGTSLGQPGWDARADFNGDNTITGADFSLLATNYGRQGPIPVTAQAAELVTPAGEPRANILIQPPARNVANGATFTVDIAIQAGALAVDSVDAYLTFNRAYLRVVDAAGNETSSIVAGSALPLVLQNSADNSKGRIVFSAGRQFSGAPPSGDFVVATVRFKAVAPTGSEGTSLAFGADTNIYYQGNAITGTRSGGVVVVGGAATGHLLYVPMVTR